MKEINYKDMKFNPFRSALPLRSSKNLIGDEWMLESGFLYQDTIDANYPQRDFHTMYVGKIEKILVKDDEYLK